MMEFLNTVMVEMTKGNFSFAILVVGILQLVVMLRKKKKKNKRKR